jgi:hypothetical protein
MACESGNCMTAPVITHTAPRVVPAPQSEADTLTDTAWYLLFWSLAFLGCIGVCCWIATWTQPVEAVTAIFVVPVPLMLLACAICIGYSIACMARARKVGKQAKAHSPTESPPLAAAKTAPGARK